MNLDKLYDILNKCTAQTRKGDALQGSAHLMRQVAEGKPIQDLQGGGVLEVYAMSPESLIPHDLERVDLHFVTIAVDKEAGEACKAELIEVLNGYPEPERLAGGPSYIEVGGHIGDQGAAFQLFALGKVLGLWDVITPETMGFTGEQARQMAGAGFVMMTGYSSVSDPQGAERSAEGDRILFLNNCDNEGIASGQPTKKDWRDAFEALEECSALLDKDQQQGSGEEFMILDIHAPVGTKVRPVFKDGQPWGGYAADQSRVAKHLVEGAWYTVASMDIDSWSTDVRLEEVPGVVFNSVSFEQRRDRDAEGGAAGPKDGSGTDPGAARADEGGIAPTPVVPHKGLDEQAREFASAMPLETYPANKAMMVKLLNAFAHHILSQQTKEQEQEPKRDAIVEGLERYLIEHPAVAKEEWDKVAKAADERYAAFEKGLTPERRLEILEEHAGYTLQRHFFGPPALGHLKEMRVSHIMREMHEENERLKANAPTYLSREMSVEMVLRAYVATQKDWIDHITGDTDLGKPEDMFDHFFRTRLSALVAPLPAEQEPGPWVSVKKQLPEPEDSVLWCKEPVDEPCAVHSMLDEGFKSDYYTHWMPHPAPPSPDHK